jgi:hypothetical protein
MSIDFYRKTLPFLGGSRSSIVRLRAATRVPPVPPYHPPRRLFFPQFSGISHASPSPPIHLHLPLPEFLCLHLPTLPRFAARYSLSTTRARPSCLLSSPTSTWPPYRCEARDGVVGADADDWRPVLSFMH